MNIKKFGWILMLAALMAVIFNACGSNTAATDSEKLSSLVYESSMELTHAEGFSVDYYEDGYALITVSQETRYLVVPEGLTAPEELDEDIVIFQQPLDDIYLAATAVMDMFVSIDALDHLSFSSIDADSWYIDEAKARMEIGDIIYAGKYSAPDYELLLSGGCSLAIENTMIYHSPEIKEQLESLGIPVFVDYSSYETDPLGRMEWVKLYGVLTGKEEAANQAFESQAELYESSASVEDTGLTVAFFYITSAGAVNVRKSSDYLAKMIEQAGGTYIFSDLGDEDDSASSSMNMQMEEFYAAAKDADYIIYNSTTQTELSDMGDFLSLSPLLENFKAVQDNHVFCTTNNLYQSSMELGQITLDIHHMLTGETDDLTYLYQVTE